VLERPFLEDLVNEINNVTGNDENIIAMINELLFGTEGIPVTDAFNAEDIVEGHLVNGDVIGARIAGEIQLEGEMDLAELEAKDFKGRTFDHIVGFTTFSGNVKGVQSNEQVEALIEARLQEMIARYGRENIVVVCGATDFGGVHSVYNVAERLGLATMGLVAGVGVKSCQQDIRKCDYYYIEQDIVPWEGAEAGDWGSESSRFVGLIDELIAFGGGAQAAEEIQNVAQAGKAVTMVRGVRTVMGTIGQAEMSYMVHKGEQSLVERIIADTEARIEQLKKEGADTGLIKAVEKQLKEATKALKYSIEGDVAIEETAITPQDAFNAAGTTNVTGFLSAGLQSILDSSPQGAHLVVAPETLEGTAFSHPVLTAEVLTELVNIAKKHHKDQTRKDAKRTDYLAHTLGVVAILVNELDVQDPEIIAAAFLHDILEDSIMFFRDGVRNPRNEAKGLARIRIREMLRQEIRTNPVLLNSGLMMDKVLLIVDAVTRDWEAPTQALFLPNIYGRGDLAGALMLADSLYNLRDLKNSDIDYLAEDHIFGTPDSAVGRSKVEGAIDKYLRTAMPDGKMFLEQLSTEQQIQVRIAILESILENYRKGKNTLTATLTREKALYTIQIVAPGTFISDTMGVEEMLEQALWGFTGDRGLLSRSGESVRREKVNNWRTSLQNGTFREFAVLSDVHGNINTFKALVDNFLKQGVTRFRFCGDYIDLDDQDNMKVLAFLRDLKEGRYSVTDDDGRPVKAEEVTILLGNHDLKYIQSMMGDKRAFESWIRTGGLYVLREAGIAPEAISKIFAIEQQVKTEMAGQSMSDIGRELGRRYKSYIDENPQAINRIFRAMRTDTRLKDMATWLLDNSALSYEDENGILFVHAGLPLDEQGNVQLGYQGIRGVRAIETLTTDFRQLGYLIDADDPAGVLDPRNQAVLEAAMNFVDLKWAEAIANNDELAERILNQMGVSSVIFGHTKQSLLFSVGTTRIFGIDRKMTKAYGDHGGALAFNNDGITSFEASAAVISVNEIESISKDELLADLGTRGASVREGAAISAPVVRKADDGSVLLEVINPERLVPDTEAWQRYVDTSRKLSERTLELSGQNLFGGQEGFIAVGYNPLSAQSQKEIYEYLGELKPYMSDIMKDARGVIRAFKIGNIVYRVYNENERREREQVGRMLEKFGVRSVVFSTLQEGQDKAERQEWKNTGAYVTFLTIDPGEPTLTPFEITFMAGLDCLQAQHYTELSGSQEARERGVSYTSEINTALERYAQRLAWIGGTTDYKGLLKSIAPMGPDGVRQLIDSGLITVKIRPIDINAIKDFYKAESEVLRSL